MHRVQDGDLRFLSGGLGRGHPDLRMAQGHIQQGRHLPGQAQDAQTVGAVGVDQTPDALIVRRRTGIDIAFDLHRLAHIGANDPQEILVHQPFSREGHDRDGQSLLEHLTAIGSHAEPPDIDDVDRVGKQSHGLTMVKTRRHHGDVVKMTRCKPGIVGDEMIARLHGRERIDIEKMFHRIGHRVDMSRRTGDRLCQHAPLTIEDAGRKVASLTHRGAERGPEHGLRLLFDHGDQSVPHHLNMDLGKRGIGTCDHGQISRRISSI